MEENSSNSATTTVHKNTSLATFSSVDGDVKLVDSKRSDFKWESIESNDDIWNTLLRIREIIRDPVHGDIEITLLEKHIIDLEIFQRMRGISQLGPTQLVYPGAVHNRFLHSIGTLHMAEQLVSILNKNYDSLHNYEDLKESTLKITPYQHFLIRITALVHDLAHVPFGHTLEDEGKLFKAEWEDGIRSKIFERSGSNRKTEERITLIEDLINLLRDVGIPVTKDITEESETTVFHRLLSVLQKHEIPIDSITVKRGEKIKTIFDAIEDVLSKLSTKIEVEYAEGIAEKICEHLKEILVLEEPKDKNLLLVKDIVCKNVCADLLDYSQRDMYFCGLSEKWGERFIKYLAILKLEKEKSEQEVYSLNTKGTGRVVLLAYRCEQEFERPDIMRRVQKMDVISEAIDLLRKRYMLSEKVYFHRTKLAASSMLISAVGSSKLSSQELIKWNEQQLIERLLLSPNPRTQNLTSAYCKRDLFKPIYQLGFKTESEENDVVDHFWNSTYIFYRAPQNRLEAEVHLENTLGLNPGSVSIYCPDKKMNLKKFKILVHTAPNHKIKRLGDILDTNRKKEMKVIEDKFELLWKLQVFIDPKQLDPLDQFNPKKERFIKECEDLFEFSNEYLLERNYDPRQVLDIKKDELLFQQSIDKWNSNNPNFHLTVPLQDEIMASCKRYAPEQKTEEAIYKEIESKAKSYYENRG